MFVVVIGGWIGLVAVENLHGGGSMAIMVMACYRESYVNSVLTKKYVQCCCGDKFCPAKLWCSLQLQ